MYGKTDATCIFTLCFMLCFTTRKPTFFKKYVNCLGKYFIFQSKYESSKCPWNDLLFIKSNWFSCLLLQPTSTHDNSIPGINCNIPPLPIVTMFLYNCMQQVSSTMHFDTQRHVLTWINRSIARTLVLVQQNFSNAFFCLFSKLVSMIHILSHCLLAKQTKQIFMRHLNYWTLRKKNQKK